MNIKFQNICDFSFDRLVKFIIWFNMRSIIDVYYLNSKLLIGRGPSGAIYGFPHIVLDEMKLLSEGIKGEQYMASQHMLYYT
ncbi:MAG: hypothetical protein Harvfovirus18_16 [Harvfovirus sp.]|uniref:Uncharacterized protein n=1 Tax=Harvfovirus sp. TaxID=2487768 RepID=A0A3G5A1Q4_9VIRU|nr:MAG: hypothetical protein Harvfovirus18_16 [Harvfovirus sp.]